ncbi:MAG: hypothetical protein GXY81_07435 [Candidatus Cloacimonetes bacterium]|nr:hypothetical protein [Candidatus Cloacimonadota bacterium]
METRYGSSKVPDPPAKENKGIDDENSIKLNQKRAFLFITCSFYIQNYGFIQFFSRRDGLPNPVFIRFSMLTLCSLTKADFSLIRTKCIAYFFFFSVKIIFNFVWNPAAEWRKYLWCCHWLRSFETAFFMMKAGIFSQKEQDYRLINRLWRVHPLKRKAFASKASPLLQA